MIRHSPSRIEGQRRSSYVYETCALVRRVQRNGFVNASRERKIKVSKVRGTMYKRSYRMVAVQCVRKTGRRDPNNGVNGT